MIGISILAAASLATAPAKEWPKETTFTGPMVFCGWMFSAKLAPGENLIVEDGGLDFLMYYFEKGPAQYSIYEGNHPQEGDKPAKINAGLGFPTQRIWLNNHPSYIVRATDRPISHYLHILSTTFNGTKRDFALLKSIKIGNQDHTGCSKPTYEKRP